MLLRNLSGKLEGRNHDEPVWSEYSAERYPVHTPG
jgi:hypothetical protein